MSWPCEVLLVDDVAAQVAQRRLQHVEDEFRPRGAAGRAAAQFRAELLLVLRRRRSIRASRAACRRRPACPPLSSSIAFENIWKIFEVGWWIVTRTILLCAIERMISMTCSASFEERPLVGSSKRKMSGVADHIQADVQALALAAAERSCSSGCRRGCCGARSGRVRPACRRCAATGRVVVRCGARIAAANSRFSSMVRCSSKASSCGM